MSIYLCLQHTAKRSRCQQSSLHHMYTIFLISDCSVFTFPNLYTLYHDLCFACSHSSFVCLQIILSMLVRPWYFHIVLSRRLHRLACVTWATSASIAAGPFLETSETAWAYCYLAAKQPSTTMGVDYHGDNFMLSATPGKDIVCTRQRLAGEKLCLPCLRRARMGWSVDEGTYIW